MGFAGILLFVITVSFIFVLMFNNKEKFTQLNLMNNKQEQTIEEQIEYSMDEDYPDLNNEQYQDYEEAFQQQQFQMDQYQQEMLDQQEEMQRQQDEKQINQFDNMMMA